MKLNVYSHRVTPAPFSLSVLTAPPSLLCPPSPPQETGRYPAYKEMVSEYCWLDRRKWLRSPRLEGKGGGLRVGPGSLKKKRARLGGSHL